MWTVQLILLLAAPYLALGKSLTDRIMNGDNLRIDDAPYMVAFVSMTCSDTVHTFGSGTILNARYVLTAAHLFHLDP
jgi:secreted trypsin-like serine protease